MKLFTGVLFLFYATSVVGDASAQVSPQAGAASSVVAPTVIANVRVFDGVRVIPRTTVVITGDRVTAVGADVAYPKNAVVIDGAGRTLLPGLIDAHTHTRQGALETSLAFGVTTTLDMFAPADFARGVRAAQRAGGAGVNARADMLSAGIAATPPGGHGTEYGMQIPTLSKPSDAAAWVAARAAEGSEYIKIIVDNGGMYGMRIPTLDSATVRAVVAAARARRLMTVAHVATLGDARMVVNAGVDGLAHIWMDSLADAAFVQTLKRRNVFVVPTLSVTMGVTGKSGGVALLDDRRVANMITREDETALRAAFPRMPTARSSYDSARASVGVLSRAGVRILAGTDFPNPGTMPGASLHRELELLVDAGMAPLDALKAATSGAAAAFAAPLRSAGLGAGAIRVGARANLVLVDGDPTADITATRAIVAVWKNGERFDREAYAKKIAGSRAAAADAASAPRGARADAGLLSDFEDGTPRARIGGQWMITSDALAGGRSKATLAVMDSGAAGSWRAMRVAGTIDGALPYAWGGAMLFLSSPPMRPVDVSAATGLRFRFRGNAGSYRVMLFTKAGGQAPLTVAFDGGDQWTSHTFKWSDFNTDGRDVVALGVVAGPAGGEFAFMLDDVELIR